MLVSVRVLLDVELNDEEPGDGREHSSINGSAVVGCRRGALVIGGGAIATGGGGEHSSVNGSAVVGCRGSAFVTG